MKAAVVITFGFVLLVGDSARAADQTTRTIGRFQVGTSKDVMTDEVRKVIVATSDAGELRFGIRCDARGDNPPKVLIMWQRYLPVASQTEVDVEWRFPPAKSESAQWLVTSGNGGAILPAKEVGAFLAKATNSESLVVRVSDDDDIRTITDRVRLDGLSAALRTLPCAARYIDRETR